MQHTACQCVLALPSNSFAHQSYCPVHAAWPRGRYMPALPAPGAVQGEPPAKRQAVDPQQQQTQQQAAMGSFQQYALQPAQQVQQAVQPQFGLQQQLLAGGAAGLAAGNTNMTSLLAQLQHQRVSWEG